MCTDGEVSVLVHSEYAVAVTGWTVSYEIILGHEFSYGKRDGPRLGQVGETDYDEARHLS